MMVGLGCPSCGETEFCDGMTSCYICGYLYPVPEGPQELVVVEAKPFKHVCGACDRGAHKDCSGWCFCGCEGCDA